MREKYEEGYDRGAFQTATNPTSRPVNRTTPRESPRGVRRLWPVLARVYDDRPTRSAAERVRRERGTVAADAALRRETLTLSVLEPAPVNNSVLDRARS